MSSLLASTNNTRALVKGSLTLVRSDVPNKLSEDEIHWLLAHNLRTIIDLRQTSEMNEKECALADHQEFTYIHLPVTGGNKIPATPADVATSYVKMVDDAMWQLIDIVEHAPTNVLYFCNAGKDRTGVVSALLLLRLGASKEEIIADYLESGDNLKDVLTGYAAESPEIDLNVITPKREYMAVFLDTIQANFSKVKTSKGY